MFRWQTMLREAFEERGDDFSKMICTLTEEERLELFTTRWRSFTAWGENFVYFPVCYEDSIWIGSVPRNPCDIVTEPQGG
jgi:hypothetical protein